jgi:hypothetical protein
MGTGVINSNILSVIMLTVAVKFIMLSIFIMTVAVESNMLSFLY